MHVASVASLLGLACLSCRSAPSPIPRSVDAAARDAGEGVPEAWAPWVGFDEWAEPEEIDWKAYLSGEESGSGGLSVWSPVEGCIFEIVHRSGATQRRWYVLVQPDYEAGGIELQSGTLTHTEQGRSIEVPLFFCHARVTVAPEGRDVAPARDALLPMVSSNFGYVVGADQRLVEARTELEAAGAFTEEASDRFTTAVSRPAIALLSLFRGIQEHPELSEILRQVVDAPSVLEIVLAGGLHISLEPDLEAVETCECPVGDAHFETGVRFPALLRANGDPALEMEIFATNSVPPIQIMGGLVALRAWLPGDESRSVELRLVGARDLLVF